MRGNKVTVIPHFYKIKSITFTLFFLLVGAGGLISFCRILRHVRVMFSTTTGVFMFTDMRNRLSARRDTNHRTVSEPSLTTIKC